ncbi:conserved hypothetical protein [Frankia canadensis]|uniref:Uncharacterized protein n=1 Tax=Frankia canadensis TaxID=1836972 RepID=A0A2I2KV98_9ACTN|nr:conserved hypothetical protein [Frankia canadensis]SOU56876.1 conserved hypothetical protein [Frankia canadensis]
MCLTYGSSGGEGWRVIWCGGVPLSPDPAVPVVLAAPVVLAGRTAESGGVADDRTG